ncbi:VWA domain-containing protein [Chloroflexota bacterium]
MGISISDIKRAMLSAGDVSAYTEIWHEILGVSHFSGISTLGIPVTLPQTGTLFAHSDKNLAGLAALWEKGEAPQLLPKKKMDLTLISLAPYSRNTAGYLDRIINDAKPDVLAISTPPLELRANFVYVLSLPSAIGLPVYGEIMTTDFGQFYKHETFSPGSTDEILIAKSRLNGIPLMPIGIPKLKPEFSEAAGMIEYADSSSAEEEANQPKALVAYRNLDNNLNGTTGLSKGTEITRNIANEFIKSTGLKAREKLMEDARYIASRINEISTHANISGRKTKILAIVDIKHFTDIEYVQSLLGQGITDEVFLPPQSYAPSTSMLMVSRSPAELNEKTGKTTPRTTLAQTLFKSKFDEFIKIKDSEVLTDLQTDEVISQIVGRTRQHPAVIRGTSVRGTITLKEVFHGFRKMNSALDREGIRKAALITLPPRITVRQGEDKYAIINDIVKELLYDISFFGEDNGEISPNVLEQLSLNDIMDALENLKPPSTQDEKKLSNKSMPTVISGADNPMANLNEQPSFNRRKEQPSNQPAFMKKALEYLMNDLEEKLKNGEITPAEYTQKKEHLENMMKALSPSKPNMSSEEMANTIMELMDAQDKQFGGGVSFERMHVYYHIKAGDASEELIPQKRDYYGLKMLIGDMEREGMLSPGETDLGLTLTSHALNVLLDYLLVGESGNKRLRSFVNSARTLADEHKNEIRRYSSGDIFRDISVRHTLKEIARQQKTLSDVKKRDFRVFMKQHQRMQSDIVLCLDTSGSMSSHYKLIYTRLVSAGLVKAALNDKNRIGVVTFNDIGQKIIPLTDQNGDAIFDYIAKLTARANTNIAEGIRCASELLLQQKSHNQKHIVLITDGQATAISEKDFDRLKETKKEDLTEESAIMETRKASARGISVSVIHMAGENEESNRLVRRIAEVGKGKVYRVSNSRDLEGLCTDRMGMLASN